MSATRREQPRLRRVARWGRDVLAVVGALALVVTVVATVLDLRGFDRTRGGYDPPYEGWTGTPIDWSAGAVTSTGFLAPGRVVSTELDCTDGMLSFSVLGASVDYRVVSERAIVVHRPREACQEAGFEPEF